MKKREPHTDQCRRLLYLDLATITLLAFNLVAIVKWLIQ